MNRADVEIKWKEADLKAIEQEIGRLKVELRSKVVTDAIFDASKIVLDQAVQNVPVKTGGLRSSLKRRRIRDISGVGASVFASRSVKPGAFHAHLVEYGHRIVVRRGLGLYEKGFYPPRPFLRPALEENVDRIMDFVGKRVAIRVNKTLAK